MLRIRWRASRRRTSWRARPARQRAGIGLLAAIELALLVLALIDLVRRPSEQVRGRRLAWLPLLFVQPIGPLTYLLVGRRRAVPQAG